MSREDGASLLPVEDYEAIEAAVKETVRGRWFLEEFARRNRHADTEAIVSQIERLEKSIRSERAVPDIDRIRLDLADMAEAIVRTKHEIAAIKHEGDEGSRFQQASNELDAIVMQTEGATNDILLNAEKIQELAWTLRESGAEDASCDGLEMAATEIYTACSFQDLTGQRTRKVVTVLRYLESRINAMMSIWGFEGLMDSGLPLDMSGGSAHNEDTRPDAHLLNGPALIGQGMNQGSIDDLLTDHSDHVSQSEADDMFDGSQGGRMTADGDSYVLADDLEMIGAADTDASADVFSETISPLAEPSPASETDLDLRDADVFAQSPAEAPRGVSQPTTIRQRVGNTVQEIVVEAEEAPSPALTVVAVEDPIEAMTPARRLTTFGQ